MRLRRDIRALVALSVLTPAVGNALGQIDCGAIWSARLPYIKSGTVWTITVYDDGTGPSLYAAGEFSIVDGKSIKRILRWDGTTSWPVGGGLSQIVTDLAVFDDGIGDRPALYAVGAFLSPGKYVARWDGSEWSAVGEGVQAIATSALVWDDGAGPQLYVGSYGSIARWDGTKWSTVGGGLVGSVNDLAVLDDGTGPALYAADVALDYGHAGHYVARWNGVEWMLVGDRFNDTVCAVAGFDDGAGTHLYAAGAFYRSGDKPVDHVVRWDGNQWSSVGCGPWGTVLCLEVFDDGTGPALYAGGTFLKGQCSDDARRIEKRNGQEWLPLDTGVLDSKVAALTVFDDMRGGGPGLYVGGVITQAGPEPAGNLARWGELPPCAAELTCDAHLNLFDFLVFVNLFNAGDATADCDESGALDVFDFLCYQNSFQAGCP